jgi:uncharacterized membrane protein YdjX (TVP38/TMEM64 family)
MTLKQNKFNVFLITSILSLGILTYFFVPGFKLQVNIAVTLLAQADIIGLRSYIGDFGFYAPLISIALMVLQSLVSPLPAFVITFANSWIFGWVWGAIYSWTGAMIGATVCFWIGKAYGRPVVEKFTGVKGLELTDRFFETYGEYSILIARLIPVVPFDIISYAAGLTKISFWSFLWATGIGQLPATLVYSWLGENMTPSAKYALWALSGFIILFILSFAMKKRVEVKLKDK